ncbi:MAG: hypothetical protein MHM6MM_006738 [Cercozoa sp. M6MM]
MDEPELRLAVWQLQVALSTRQVANVGAACASARMLLRAADLGEVAGERNAVDACANFACDQCLLPLSASARIQALQSGRPTLRFCTPECRLRFRAFVAKLSTSSVYVRSLDRVRVAQVLEPLGITLSGDPDQTRTRARITPQQQQDKKASVFRRKRQQKRQNDSQKQSQNMSQQALVNALFAEADRARASITQTSPSSDESSQRKASSLIDAKSEAKTELTTKTEAKTEAKVAASEKTEAKVETEAKAEAKVETEEVKAPRRVRRVVRRRRKRAQKPESSEASVSVVVIDRQSQSQSQSQSQRQSQSAVSQGKTQSSFDSTERRVRFLGTASPTSDELLAALDDMTLSDDSDGDTNEGYESLLSPPLTVLTVLSRLLGERTAALLRAQQQRQRVSVDKAQGSAAEVLRRFGTELQQAEQTVASLSQHVSAQTLHDCLNSTIQSLAFPSIDVAQLVSFDAQQCVFFALVLVVVSLQCLSLSLSQSQLDLALRLLGLPQSYRVDHITSALGFLSCVH